MRNLLDAYGAEGEVERISPQGYRQDLLIFDPLNGEPVIVEFTSRIREARRRALGGPADEMRTGNMRPMSARPEVGPPRSAWWSSPDPSRRQHSAQGSKVARERRRLRSRSPRGRQNERPRPGAACIAQRRPPPQALLLSMQGSSEVGRRFAALVEAKLIVEAVPSTRFVRDSSGTPPTGFSLRWPSPSPPRPPPRDPATIRAWPSLGALRSRVSRVSTSRLVRHRGVRPRHRWLRSAAVSERSRHLGKPSDQGVVVSLGIAGYGCGCPCASVKASGR